jgi:hypothetical protein
MPRAYDTITPFAYRGDIWVLVGQVIKLVIRDLDREAVLFRAHR